MTTSTVQLELQPRELLGKKVGRLRRAGITPVHLYGAGLEPRALQCAAPRLIQALSRAGASSPITVTIEGEQGSHMAFAREIQWDPRRDTVLHVDLLAADISRPVTAQVSVSLTGEAPAATRAGGSVIHQLQDVEISALPLEMPAQIEVDISVMTDPSIVIRAGDLQLSAGATLLTDTEAIIARIDILRTGAGVDEDEAAEQQGDSSVGAE